MKYISAHWKSTVLWTSGQKMALHQAPRAGNCSRSPHQHFKPHRFHELSCEIYQAQPTLRCPVPFLYSVQTTLYHTSEYVYQRRTHALLIHGGGISQLSSLNATFSRSFGLTLWHREELVQLYQMKKMHPVPVCWPEPPHHFLPFRFSSLYPLD